MINECRRDVFAAIGKADAICITTNGFVRKDGGAVMGSGVARTAREKYSGIERDLGDTISQNGNIAAKLRQVEGTWIVSFPTKGISGTCNEDKSNIVPHRRAFFSPGDKVPGFWLVSDLDIIEMSAMQLRKMADGHDWNLVALVRPGCQNGCLDWREVKPILEKYLDERFWVCTL